MPFWTILKIIPQSYSNEITLNKNNDCQDIHGEKGAKTIHKAMVRNTYKKY